MVSLFIFASRRACAARLSPSFSALITWSLAELSIADSSALWASFQRELTLDLILGLISTGCPYNLGLRLAPKGVALSKCDKVNVQKCLVSRL